MLFRWLLVVGAAVVSTPHYNEPHRLAQDARGVLRQSTATFTRATGSSTIRGRVTAVDGQALAGASVSAGDVASATGEVATATTDANGSYEISDLPAGRYVVTAWTREHVPFRYRQKRLDDRDIEEVAVGDGQTVGDVNVTLYRPSVVSGQVLDRTGKPVPAVRVMLAQQIFTNGRQTLMPVVASAGLFRGSGAATNERGEYRIEATAGTYLLVAAPPEASGAVAMAQADGTAFAYTFLPGTPDAAAAQRLRLDLGEVRTNANITLSAVQVFTISGAVIDAHGAPASSGRVQVAPRNAVNSNIVGFGSPKETTIQRDGRFVVSGVVPGHYSVRALLPEPDDDRVEARIIAALEHTAGAVVTVDKEDVRDLRLAASRLVAVRGRVVFADQTASRAIVPADVCVAPTPWDVDDGWLSTGRVAAPGAPRLAKDFTFAWQMLPGHIRVTAALCASMHEEHAAWQISGVRANGRDVTDEGVVIPADGLHDLEIVLTAGHPQVTGVVRDTYGVPKKNRVVLLFAQDRSHWSALNDRYFSFAFSDADGRFRTSAPPGDYFIVAVDRGSLTEWRDPSFLEPLAARSIRISLASRERRTLDLSIDGN